MQFEKKSGEVIPWREISQAQRFDEQNRASLPDVIRVELYQTEAPLQLPEVLKRSRNSGCTFFSEKIKAIIEELEPGVHEFRPVEVRLFPAPAPEQDIVLATYYMWHSPPEVHAIIPEASAWQSGIGLKARDESSGHLSSDPDKPCVLRAAEISGRHCWREIYRKELQGADGELHVIPTFSFFCSSEFYSRIKFNEIEGFNFIKKCETR